MFVAGNIAERNRWCSLGEMSSIANARWLRREQTVEEKELWRALRAGRFAGFKFRRQHPHGNYTLDFYCPAANLSIELDGFQHGMPEERQRDEVRVKFLVAQGIEELRFWNHQWKKNHDGVLLEIWNALHRRTGCAAVMRKLQNHRFAPPNIEHIKGAERKPDAELQSVPAVRLASQRTAKESATDNSSPPLGTGHRDG